MRMKLTDAAIRSFKQCATAYIADERVRKAMANQTTHILHAMFKWAKQPARKFTSRAAPGQKLAPGRLVGAQASLLLLFLGAPGGTRLPINPSGSR